LTKTATCRQEFIIVPGMNLLTVVGWVEVTKPNKPRKLFHSYQLAVTSYQSRCGQK